MGKFFVEFEEGNSVRPKKRRRRTYSVEVEEEEKKKDGDGKMKQVEECTPSVCGNAAMNDEIDDGGVDGLCGSSRREETPMPKRNIFDENGIKIDSNTCHQCHRKNKRVVRCTKCKTKRFCILCIQNWYPQMTEDQIAQACPFCLGNCNCRTCLRMEGRLRHGMNTYFSVGSEERFNHTRYLLNTIIPFLKQFNQEQMMEKEVKAKIQGDTVSSEEDNEDDVF